MRKCIKKIKMVVSSVIILFFHLRTKQLSHFNSTLNFEYYYLLGSTFGSIENLGFSSIEVKSWSFRMTNFSKNKWLCRKRFGNIFVNFLHSRCRSTPAKPAVNPYQHKRHPNAQNKLKHYYFHSNYKLQLSYIFITMVHKYESCTYP